MAPAIKDQGKTGFVSEFLSTHPEGNVKAVNEAWAAAGNDGTIGATLIQKLRSQMGLSGNLRAKPEPRTSGRGKTTVTRSKTAARKFREAPASLGKTSFVKEFLNDHPQGNPTAVNEAWHAAGMKGTISATLVNKTRATLGLTGNLRASSGTEARAATTGKKRGRPRKDATAAAAGTPLVQPRGRRSERTTLLMAVEEEIDRLIFTAMGIGDLTEVEAALRSARRGIYKAMSN